MNDENHTGFYSHMRPTAIHKKLIKAEADFLKREKSSDNATFFQKNIQSRALFIQIAIISFIRNNLDLLSIQ
jgi:hypothetical protein